MRSYISHSIMKKVFLLSNVMLICLYVLIMKSRLHVQNFHFPQDTSISLCCVWFILDTKFSNCKFTLNFFSFRCFLCKHFVYCIYIYIHLLFPMKNSINSQSQCPVDIYDWRKAGGVARHFSKGVEIVFYIFWRGPKKFPIQIQG